jgi:hypothetical protein
MLEWLRVCATVTLTPFVSKIAPPLRTLARVIPWRNVPGVLVPSTLTVPPLKLKVEFPALAEIGKSPRIWP